MPRICETVEPESIECGCGEMVKIGEDRTERLDVVPAQLRVIVTIRPKYAFRRCEEGVTPAPPPSHLIPGGLLTFLHDGRVEIDSNFVENRIRPVKLTAKNALFAGTTRAPAHGAASARSSRPAR